MSVTLVEEYNGIYCYEVKNLTTKYLHDLLKQHGAEYYGLTFKKSSVDSRSSWFETKNITNYTGDITESLFLYTKIPLHKECDSPQYHLLKLKEFIDSSYNRELDTLNIMAAISMVFWIRAVAKRGQDYLSIVDKTDTSKRFSLIELR